MLSFSKGFNNQNNINTNNYSQMGRKSVEQIREEMVKSKFEYMQNTKKEDKNTDLNKPYDINNPYNKNNPYNMNKESQEKIKTVDQVNNGSKAYDTFHAFNHMNKN